MAEHIQGTLTTFMDGQGLWVIQDRLSGCILARGLSREAAKRMAAAPEMLEALEGITARYVDLAGSGDCGFWNPEEELQVIQARAAIARAKGE